MKLKHFTLFLLKSILLIIFLLLFGYCIVFSGGDFLFDFLGPTFISILIAVFSITVSSIISLGKNLSDLVVKYGDFFPGAYKSLKDGIKEYLIILLIFMFLISIKKNIFFTNNVFWSIGINSYLTYLVLLIFQIIYDVSKAHFLLFEKLNELHKKLDSNMGGASK